MSENSETISMKRSSRDDYNESGLQEIQSSKRRAWTVAGGVTFVVLLTIMTVTLPPALKDENTTPSVSASTGIPTEAPDTFTISITYSTTSTKSTIAPTAHSTDIRLTTNGAQSAKSTVIPPILSTTASFETTTVSVVEKVDECEYINELLEVDICVLDARYPLNHCNKKDKGR